MTDHLPLLVNGVVESSLVLLAALGACALTSGPRWRLLIQRTALVLVIAAPLAAAMGAPRLGLLQAPTPKVTVARVPLVSGPTATVTARPAAPIARDAGPAKRNPAFDPWMLVAGLWAGGALLVVARYLTATASLNRAFARAAPPNPAQAAAFARLRERAGLGGAVSLRISDAGAGPCTFGWLRPRVLAPAACLDDPDKAEAVLAHELCHVANRDAFWLAVAALAGAVHWFNPLVWKLTRRHAEALELACDDAVAERFMRPGAYARALVEVAYALKPLPLEAARRLELATHPTMSADGIGRRIRRLTSGEPTGRGPSRFMHGVFVAGCGGAVIAFTLTGVVAARPKPATHHSVAAASGQARPVSAEPRAPTAPTIETAASIPDPSIVEGSADIDAAVAAEAAAIEAEAAAEAAAEVSVMAVAQRAEAIGALTTTAAAEAIAEAEAASAEASRDLLVARIGGAREAHRAMLVPKTLPPPRADRSHLYIEAKDDRVTVWARAIGLMCSGGGCVGEGRRGADVELTLSRDTPAVAWSGCTPSSDGRRCRLALDGESARVMVRPAAD